MSELKTNIINIIKNALDEDHFNNDITSDSCIDDEKNIEFNVIAKEDIIFCGNDIINLGFEYLKEHSKFRNKQIKINFLAKDGDLVAKNQIIASGFGNARLVFAGERVILNLIQHLSGIATLTNQFVKNLNNSKIKILDTRKTIPNLRLLQKYAVKIGGGSNHRFSLADMILIKDNHIAINGGVTNTLEFFKTTNKKIEVECDNYTQVKEAIEFDPDVIMLDNMSPDDIKKCSKIIRNANPKIEIEVSGGINLENIHKYKNLDIDFISIGFLTHSIKAADISLECKVDL